MDDLTYPEILDIIAEMVKLSKDRPVLGTEIQTKLDTAIVEKKMDMIKEAIDL